MTQTARRNVTTDSGARKEIPGPGRDLYLMVCGGFLARLGLRFAPWCRANALDVGRVRAALFGLSDSDEARELRRKAMIAAGLLPAEEN
jgi:hypothetical protein